MRVLLIVAMLVGCGVHPQDRRTIKIVESQDGVDGKDGKDGIDAQPCSVAEVPNGALIVCPDGTTASINHGDDGLDGAQGEKGETGEQGAAGQDGVDGLNGQDGVDGKVIKINTDPIYIGYYCSRNVIKIGNKVYMISSGLVRLGKSWVTVSHSCQIRYHKGQVQTK